MFYISRSTSDGFSTKFGDLLGPMAQGYENEYDVEKNSETMLPYGIQNVRDVMQFSDRPLRTKPVRDLRVLYKQFNFNQKT